MTPIGNTANYSKRIPKQYSKSSLLLEFFVAKIGIRAFYAYGIYVRRNIMFCGFAEVVNPQKEVGICKPQITKRSRKSQEGVGP